MIRPLRSRIFCFLFLVASATTPLFSAAQNATPNAGFEDWTAVNFFGNFFIPNGWDNLDSATAIINILTCVRTEDAHSGSYAVKLITYEVNIFGTDTANGIITTGNLITIPPYGISGGIPYHERPDSFACWIKYLPVGGDSTQIQFDLLGTDDTIATAVLKIGATVSNYTRFTAPLNYFSNETPELSRWLISSGNGFNAIPGSILFVDDLSLIFSTGIHETEAASGMQLLNTLITDEVMLSNPKNLSGKMLLYNACGALQASFPIKNQSEKIPLTNFTNGIYALMIAGDDGAILLRKKIIVQH